MHRVVAIIAVPSLLVLAIGLVAMKGSDDDNTAAPASHGGISFQSGDTVATVSDQVEFRRGGKTISRLDKDSQMLVLQVQGSWVGGNVTVEGKSLTGWIHARDLRLLKNAADAEPPSKSVAFPTSQEPRETLGDKFARLMAKERETKSAAKTAGADSAKEPAGSVVSQGSSDAQATNSEMAVRVGIAQNPEDLADFESLQLIGRLVIIGDQFSNRSLKPLEGMRILSLSIEAVNVGNAGLVHVTRVKHLQELRLWTPDVSDSGLEIIAKMSDLESLDLEGTSVRGTELPRLSGLSRLSKLTLGPKTGDAEVALLPKLSSLEEVDLRSCYQLTEASLASLVRLERLKVVWLPARLVAAGEQAIRKAHPQCEVRS